MNLQINDTMVKYHQKEPKGGKEMKSTMLRRPGFAQLDNMNEQCFFDHVLDQEQHLTCNHGTGGIDVRHIE